MSNEYFFYGIPKHTCVYCGIKFRHKINLTKHLKKEHEENNVLRGLKNKF